MYGTFFSLWSNSIEEYIIISEKETEFRVLNPITYYWLEHINRLEVSDNVALPLDKMMFQLVRSHENMDFDKINNFSVYGTYYNEFKIDSEVLLNNISSLSSFLEHFHFDNKKQDESMFRKIERSIFSPHLSNPEYVLSIGKLIAYITGGSIQLEEKERFPALLSLKFSPFHEYVELK